MSMAHMMGERGGQAHISGDAVLRSDSVDGLLCPPLTGQVPVEPKETSRGLTAQYRAMEASPVSESSSEKPTERRKEFDGKKVAIKQMLKTDNDRYLHIPGHPKPLVTEVALLLMMRREPVSPFVCTSGLNILKRSLSLWSTRNPARACVKPEVLNEPRFHAVPTNVWALGVLLYKMVNGCCPFGSRREITQAKITFQNSTLSEAQRIARVWGVATVAGGAMGNETQL